MPSGAEAIETYLSARAIKGIGPRTASRIVKLFGDQTFEIMEQHPERLAEVPGISPQKAKAIGQSFQKQFGMRKLLEFLLSNGLPGELAMPLYKAYGDLAMDALRDDPYLLTEDYFGAAFAAVDQFAVHQGIEAEDFRRVQAATVYTLRHNLGNGHTFLPAEKLCAATATMINVDPDVVRETLGDLNLAGKLVVDTLRDISVCYLPEYYEAATYVAQRMLELSATPQQVPDRLEGTLRAVQQELGTEYASEQARAILTAARSSVMLLTGGPGTGKTTTVNGILGLFDRLGIKTVLAAPTGRAANRLKELCGREAATIHRLLETQFDPESGKLCFMHDESEPLKADAVVTWLIDLMMGIPHIVLLILISYALGKGFWGVTIGVAVTHWPSLARVVRAEILQCRESTFVAVARKLGQSPLRIALKHMVPYVLPQFIVGLILLFPHAILHEAAVTFLGFGLPPEQPAIGVILSESMAYLSAGMWWLAVFPGLALIATVLLFDVAGSNLRKLIDPHSSQE